MAKRGRKKKFKLEFNVSPETLRSVFAIVLLLLSALLLISFFAPNYIINSYIQKYVRLVFGHSSFVLPIILAIIGLLFIDALKNKIKEVRIIIGLVLMLIAIAGFAHVFINLDSARSVALAGGGGGMLGYILTSALTRTISVVGSVLVFLALLASAVILIFDVSIDQLILYSQELAQKFILKRGNAVSADIEISTELNPQVETAALEQTGKRLVEKVKEPTFEIIPSMSEPQTALGVPTAADLPVSSQMVPSLPYSDKVWELPPIELLDDEDATPPDTGDVEKNKKIITETLRSFNIPVEVVDAHIGPAVTKYILEAPAGVKVAKISNLQYDLALALASSTGSVRIEAPIPGESYIGIEVPNKKRAMVNFKSLISSEAMKGLKSKLGVVLGKDVGGVTHVYDISKMPHLLIAGATGSGKSIFIHSLIFSILFRATPQEVKFIMVDPKRVELSPYQDIPHLYTPLVTDIEKSPAVFKWAVTEMTRRYKLFESAKARNIDAYNEKSGFQAMPHIVIIVDELAEIMIADPSAVEKSIIRIAQLARATGIHLVLAAQRPSANVITGLIKANIPCRVAFNVTGQVDSRVIIDQSGAEKLLGKGDMLFVPPDKPNPVRLQGANVTDAEIANVANFVKNQGVTPEYKDEILQTPSDSITEKSVSAGGEGVDDLFDEAMETVVSAGKASASLLQRRLSIGYARAARILDELEQKNIIGPAQGSKPRDVLVDNLELDSADQLDDTDDFDDLPSINS